MMVMKKKTKERALTRRNLNRLIRLLEPLYRRGNAPESVTVEVAAILIEAEVPVDSTVKLFKGLLEDTRLVEEYYKHSKQFSRVGSLADALTVDWGDGYTWDPGYATELEDRIRYIITYDQFQGCVVAKTGTNTSIVNNTSINQLVYVKEREVNGRDYSTETVVLEACLTGLVVYDSPLVDEPKRFQATFQPSAYKRSISIGPALIEDIVAYLLESGLVVANRLVKDALPALFNAYIQSGEAVVKSGVEYPGFYNTPGNGLSVVNFKLDEVELSELEFALDLLYGIDDYFVRHKEVLQYKSKLKEHVFKPVFKTRTGVNIKAPVDILRLNQFIVLISCLILMIVV